MSLDALINLFSYANAHRISELPAAELSSKVRELVILADETEGLVDFDRLMGIGMTISRSTRISIDAVVIECMQSSPSARRIDLCCALLSGLWHPSFFKGTIQVDSLKSLKSVWDLVSTNEDCINSFAHVVLQASRSIRDEEGSNIIREILLQIQKSRPADGYSAEVEGLMSEAKLCLDRR